MSTVSPTKASEQSAVPVFKVTRGKSEQYLKDERALEDYLIDSLLDGAVLRRLVGGGDVGVQLGRDRPRLRAVHDDLGEPQRVLVVADPAA